MAYDLHPELRFHVTQVDIKGDYLLVDHLMASRTVLARVLVENPEFDISYWYAEQRSRELGLTDRITHRQLIGDAISIVATKLLTDGISLSYPCTNPRLNPEFRLVLCAIVKIGFECYGVDRRCGVRRRSRS